MVKVRIAPSPTGNLHIGTARTALFNWLFARHHGGEFLLRIEDTDLERSDKKFEKNILDGLRWLGFKWDGEITRQSERLDIYEKYLQKLLDSSRAFWCHHGKDELESERTRQLRNNEPQRHLCDHKNDERGKKPGQLIRLAVPWDLPRKIKFSDIIRGQIEWDERLIGDLSIAKDLRTPLYNFAVVVDDITMEITHVIRGDDHISNTPKQILIYEALDRGLPQFAHLPLILAPDRSKLSKRHGAVSVTEYKKDYLPEALVNFMGFLGYTYSREILTAEEMAAEFDIAKVHKSGAIFNIEKLNWLNSQYIKKIDYTRFKLAAKTPWLPEAAMPLVTERLEKLSQAKDFAYFWKQPKYKTDLLRWKDCTLPEVSASLKMAMAILETAEWTAAGLRSQLDAAGGKTDNRGLVYWPLRVALTGVKASPDPVDIAYVLGKSEVSARIQAAIDKLNDS